MVEIVILLDSRLPSPYFEATFRFAYYSLFEEGKKFLILIQNLTRLGCYIDEIIIKEKIVPDNKYEKIIITKYTTSINRNPRCLEYTVHFEALKVTPILTPKQQKEYDVLVLIDNGELHIGDYEYELR